MSLSFFKNKMYDYDYFEDDGDDDDREDDN